MNNFLVSTTGSNVLIRDLGLLLVHPAVDRDLLLEFSANDISQSNDLNTAITNEEITLKIMNNEYGEYELDASEYYSGLVVANSIRSSTEEKYITEAELAAGYTDQVVNIDAVAVNITSTANLTRNIYCSDGLFQKWQVSPGDTLVIASGSAAGTYTVEEVIDQQNLIVIESIVNTSSTGTLTIYEPAASSKIGVNTTNFTVITGTTLDTALESIDNIIQSSVSDSRQIIAGAGLVGGGDLSADRTIDIIAANPSIIVTANDISVGVLQNDSMHGNRGGDSQHASATTSVAGFMSATDKVFLNDILLSSTERENIESLGISTTTGIAYINKVTLTTGSLTGGRYGVFWYAELSTDAQNRDAGARCRVNDSTDLGEYIFRHTLANSQDIFSGFREINLSAGVNTVTIDFRRPSGPNATISIRNVSISLIRVN